jgi:hypothetical protein
VESERDVVRRLGSAQFLEAAGVQHQQERASGVRVEHDRQHHSGVLVVRARLAHEDRLARVATGR